MKTTLAIIAALFLWPEPQALVGSAQQMCLCEFAAPIYPQVARLSRTQGAIHVKVSLDAEGTPEGMEVLQEATSKSPLMPVLERAAVNALRKWRFCPSSGESNHHEIVVTVIFKLLTQKKITQTDQWFPTDVSFQPPATVEITTTNATVISDR